MGMLFRITLYASNSVAGQEAAQLAFLRVAALEDTLSDYQADSELNRLREKPVGAPIPVSADLFDVLSRSRELSRLSGGVFDVTIGPEVRLWRFSRKRKVLPSAAELEHARRSVGFENMVLDLRRRTVTLLKPGMQLDVGGIAKGYAADEALKILQGRGIPQALVAASGDIAVGAPPPGQKGWRVGIAGWGAKEDAKSQTVLLKNCGISTSGDAEQFVEINGRRYSHIIDPRTGLGLRNHIQATVIGPSATMTDAMATTVCILGPEKGLQLIDRLRDAYAIVLSGRDSKLQVQTSRRFWSLFK